MISAKRV